jgi:hypothetical protein
MNYLFCSDLKFLLRFPPVLLQQEISMHPAMCCSLAAWVRRKCLNGHQWNGSESETQRESGVASALKLHRGKIKTAELEKEHGVQTYAFDIETRDSVLEVGIDADSGKVVEDSVALAADETKEKAAKKSKAR